MRGVKGHGDARREAKALGLKRYRDGRVCEHGHENPERFTSCGRCIECHKKRNATRREFKREAKKLRIARWGFDPLDLRFHRKARGVRISSSPKLEVIRLKRQLFGRTDQKNCTILTDEKDRAKALARLKRINIPPTGQHRYWRVGD